MEKDKSLLAAWNIIKTKTFVDLTHSFEPGIPHWQGFPDEERDTIYWFDSVPGSKGTGFISHLYKIVGQWGTHIDPPVHFDRSLRTIDEIPPKEMFMQLVVIDVHEKAEQNPDYVLSMTDIKEWENRNEIIPEGSFVAMRTDWSKKWPNHDALQNIDSDGIAHYPGWSMEVLKYLYEERKIIASGHETTDTDPGIATSKDDYTLESYILSRNHYQIELLANLDKVPEAGALVFVSFPKPNGGSGFPARVIAILP